jgi:hypothetical protein
MRDLGANIDQALNSIPADTREANDRIVGKRAMGFACIGFDTVLKGRARLAMVLSDPACFGSNKIMVLPDRLISARRSIASRAIADRFDALVDGIEAPVRQ